MGKKKLFKYSYVEKAIQYIPKVCFYLRWGEGKGNKKRKQVKLQAAGNCT